MKEINKYYQSYQESEERIDYLKYGILNEFGYNLTEKQKEEYDENKIIKRKKND